MLTTKCTSIKFNIVILFQFTVLEIGTYLFKIMCEMK